MIPEGWKEQKLGEIFNIKSGIGFKYAEYVDKGIPLIKIDNVSHGYIKWENITYLPEIYLVQNADLVLKKGDILLALNRPITQGKLKIARIQSEDFPSILYQRVGKIYPITDKTNQDYFYYALEPLVFNFVNRNSIGSDQPFISTTELKKINLLTPPLPEQKKIAQILSTWDKAITTTEQLLANSQQHKKALMQQLLTGKKRLLDDNGVRFSGEWKRVELGQLLDYKQPTPYLVKSTDYSDDFATPVLTAGKTFVLGYTDETEGIYDFGLPIIIFDDFTTACKFVDFPFKAKSSAMKILTAKPDVNIKYVFEAMQMLDFIIGGHQRHWISIFSNLVISLPSKEEQQKIAAVLSAADAEITVLEQKITHLKDEKKALMQQLLTGKKRVKVDDKEIV